MQQFGKIPIVVGPVAIVGLLLVSPGLLACKPRARSQPPAATTKISWQKITFDRSQISESGLVGPPSGLRSLSYEFCLPATAAALATVREIDPTLQASRSPGRIRCQRNQYLVIGDTHKPNWREILTQLVQLDTIQRIDEFWGE